MNESPLEPGEIQFGPAGWAYPDWTGALYPRGVSSGPARLRWLANYVSLVEVNATFYAPLSSRTTETWLQALEDRPEFGFTIKVWQRWTHQDGGPSEAEWRAWREGIRPLVEAGRVHAFLAQFPFRTRRAAGIRERVERIADSGLGRPLAVEFRHASWDHPETYDWLERRGLAWVDIDQPPHSEGLTATARVTGPLGYVRLHGRNREAWFAEGSGRDARYDYRYSPDEIRELARLWSHRTHADRPLLIVGNNHFHGKAVAAVLALVAELRGEKVSFPESLLRSDERLITWHRPASGHLF